MYLAIGQLSPFECNVTDLILPEILAEVIIIDQKVISFLLRWFLDRDIIIHVVDTEVDYIVVFFLVVGRRAEKLGLLSFLRIEQEIRIGLFEV
jgi:hypothetical protein